MANRNNKHGIGQPWCVDLQRLYIFEVLLFIISTTGLVYGNLIHLRYLSPNLNLQHLIHETTYMCYEMLIYPTQINLIVSDQVGNYCFYLPCQGIWCHMTLNI